MTLDGLDNAEPVLAWVAAAHLLVGVVCLLALVRDAAPVLGVHPALKPMKFGFSIAVFLASMALVVPALSLGAGARRAIAWTLALTMIAEMGPIAVQALRGTTSHFNLATRLDGALWRIMGSAIVVMTVTMAGVAVIASVRTLNGPTGAPLDPLLATAWRAGLWLFLLAAFSGFSMGGRSKHSVGGDDGGAGLPLVNWSATHGDLRVSHFVSMHALQVVPLIAAVVGWLPIASAARWTVLIVAIAIHVLIAVWTLLQAFAARPVW